MNNLLSCDATIDKPKMKLEARFWGAVLTRSPAVTLVAALTAMRLAQTDLCWWLRFHHRMGGTYARQTVFPRVLA